MSATFKIIRHHRVGEGGSKSGTDVKRLQQLLWLNNHKIRCNGVWHSETSDALVDFQRKLLSPTEQLFMCDGLNVPDVCGFSPRPYVLPDDTFLLHMALGAGVLLPLAYGSHGARAFALVHDSCEDKNVEFDMDPTRAVWGLADYPAWAVSTVDDAFDTSRPLALNCTLYANLMMSVWRRGNAHGSPFRANVSASGGSDHLARDRYGYPLMGQFKTAHEIRQIAHRHAGRLFCLEAYEDVGHMALLFRDSVYECNIFPYGCTSSPLEQWVPAHSPVWVSGPSPS